MPLMAYQLNNVVLYRVFQTKFEIFQLSFLPQNVILFISNTNEFHDFQLKTEVLFFSLW
jgi:hypothetical protein